MSDLQTDLAVHHHGRPLGSAPTLLFLHGLTDSGSGWPEAVAHWGSRFAIVAVDQRGHGRSPRFTPAQLAEHPGELMVADAIGVLEQLERPVVIGHSLGGAVALTAGVRRPELVRGLVLEDPAPLGPDEPLRSQRASDFVADLQEALSAGGDEELLEARRRRHPDWPESELLVTGQAEQQMDLDYLEAGEWKPTTPWPELFAEVAVPTLVVSGDRPEEICVDDTMERGIGKIGNPRVTLHRIGAAGHCIRREQPGEYYRVVDDWLARLGG